MTAINPETQNGEIELWKARGKKFISSSYANMYLAASVFETMSERKVSNETITGFDQADLVNELSYESFKKNV